MSPRVRCTNHCAACGAHFHSEGAFVAHRGRDGCIEPLDDDRFAALSTTAICELARVPYTPHQPGNTPRYPAGWKPGDPPMQRVVESVAVWSLRASLDAARRHWSALTTDPQEPSSAPAGPGTPDEGPRPRTATPYSANEEATR